MSGTTCEGPRTTKELLDIVTSHASGEEAVGVIFDCLKAKAKRDEDAGEGASNRPNKKKNKHRLEGSLVATADRKGVESPPRVHQNTSRSCSKGHARTMLSPSSTYTRDASS